MMGKGCNSVEICSLYKKHKTNFEMKKNTIILGILFLSTTAYSQVGINTVNPQGVFHVDGAKDNPTTGVPNTAQQANDVIVTVAGNVGVGTTSPTRKLEIVSRTSPAFRLNDGSQGNGYVLTSDANGYGTWKPVQQPVLANWSTSGYSGAVGTTGYTGTSITLPPGRWLIFTNILLTANPSPNASLNQGVWARMGWSSTQPGYIYSGGDGNVNSGTLTTSYGLASGTTLINNSTSTDKTYYLFMNESDVVGNGYAGNWTAVASSSWAENSIIAYPAN